MFCKVKKTIKEYRDFQMKMYTRIADRLEQRLAAVIAAKQKLAEQIDRDNEVIEDQWILNSNQILNTFYWKIEFVELVV